MTVSVQKSDFDVGAELTAISTGRTDVGAVVTFTGLVRGTAGSEGISDMELEHYPGMTEKALQAIEVEANKRWELQATRIIHRYGKLEPGAQIVLVIAASPHRHAAFEAAEFLMDYLKSRAPFWKKEGTSGGGKWVDARDADEAALRRWE